MVPIPQYPYYSAHIKQHGGSLIEYYLEEESGWGLNPKELERSYKEAKDNGTDVRAICLINPGNPTGQVFSKENLKDVITFAYENNLSILADEVYQENVYVDKLFHSTREVLFDMGAPFSNSVELISFHSISKGITGDCGLRGGYFEHINLDPSIEEIVYKMKSAALCSNTVGMIGLGLMVNQPDYETNSSEVVDIHN